MTSRPGRHRAALYTITTALALDVLLGCAFATSEHVSVWVGWYWAIATATTVGYGDVTPHTAAGHVIAAAVMLTVVPLFAATFSLFTTALTAVHVHAAKDEINAHVTQHLRKGGPP